MKTEIMNFCPFKLLFLVIYYVGKSSPIHTVYIVVKLVRIHIKMHTIKLIEITELLLFYYGKWWQFPLVVFTRRMNRYLFASTWERFVCETGVE